MPEYLQPAEIGERIRAKRIQAGLPVSSLAESLGTSVQNIEALETGTLPDLPGDWILLSARALRVDFRYLVTRDLDQEEQATLRVYRALANPRPQDEYDLRRFFSVAIGEHELRSVLGRPTPTLPPPLRPITLHNADHGRRAAQLERARLHLGNLPIANPFELLRQQGVTLARQQLRDSNLSGLTIIHPRVGVCVLVNYDEDLYRQFFSSAHEYAHVVLDRHALQDQGVIISYRETHSALEARANAFASEFLLPRSVLEGMPRPTTHSEISNALKRIALDFHVNTEVVLYAAARVGWMAQSDVDYWKQNRPRIGPHEKVDPDVPLSLTAAQRARRQSAIESGLELHYIELVRSALIQHHITTERASELLDIPATQVEEFFRALKVAG